MGPIVSRFARALSSAARPPGMTSRNPGPRTAFVPRPLFGPNTALLVQIEVSLIVLLMAAGSYTSITRMRRKVYATPLTLLRSS